MSRWESDDLRLSLPDGPWEVPGKRFADKDVYVLTSDRTFSAAEDFTYGVKNLKRPTIVGEVTGAGVHPVGPLVTAVWLDVEMPQVRSPAVESSALPPTSKGSRCRGSPVLRTRANR